MKYITLEEWSVGYKPENPFLAPEFSKRVLHGRSYGDIRRSAEGNWVTTSSIVKVEGNLAYTSSGSIYRLGKPSEEYIQWCRDNNHHIPTDDEPIRLVDD